MAARTVPVETLDRTVREILEAVGTPEREARQVASSLVLANQFGHDSHGVVRILEYVSFVERGLVRPAERPQAVAETGATVTVDGRHGWGQVAAHFALERAAVAARAFGAGIVTIRDCNHIGRLGEYVEALARDGLVALMWCNADPAVAPYGGRERRLGTNPIAIGIPVAGGEPLILDFATAAVAEGKLRVARAAGESVPEGLIVDREGRPSTDPQDFYDGGALLPFGAHKGYGLSLAVELLGGALSGNHPSITERYEAGNGVVLIAIRPGSFAGTAFDADVADTIDAVRATTPADPARPVLIPGDVERDVLAARAEAVPVGEEVWGQVLALHERLTAV